LIEGMGSWVTYDKGCTKACVNDAAASPVFVKSGERYFVIVVRYILVGLRFLFFLVVGVGALVAPW